MRHLRWVGIHLIEWRVDDFDGLLGSSGSVSREASLAWVSFEPLSLPV